MADTTIWIKIETKKADLRRKLEGIIRSIKGMKIQVPNDTHQDTLLIFEMGDDIDNEFQHIRSLLNSDEVAEVFLISKNSDPAVLMQAIKIGAKEFFLLALNKAITQLVRCLFFAVSPVFSNICLGHLLVWSV